jgi:prepilin-type N-terminal cleavage/methylation domain-containing protein
MNEFKSMKMVSDKMTKQNGFSIVELIITMVVFLIAISAIYGVMRIATIQKNTTGNRTDQLRSARVAVDYIRRDALNAGFGYHRAGGNAPDNMANKLFGLPKDADSQRDLMTSIVAGNDIHSNSLDTEVKTDTVAFFSRDPTFNGGDLINFTKTGNSSTTVYVETKTGAAENCKVNDLYLLESDSGTTQVVALATKVVNDKKIELAVGDPLGINQSATDTGEKKSLLMTTSGGGTIKKINLISYEVNSDGVLIRKRYGNQTDGNQTESRELVYGVSDFQIRYFMEDGTTVENPSGNHNGRDNQFKMNSIVQIQITITITPNFDGSRDVPGEPVVIREYISTRNLRYEAS